MGAHSFNDLYAHYGHKVVIAAYGDVRGKVLKRNIENIAVECLDCNEVLLDFDNPSWKQKKESGCKSSAKSANRKSRK